MYQDTQTRVKTRCDTGEFFDIEDGLHQGSALTPLLFIIVMDVLSLDVGTRHAHHVDCYLQITLICVQCHV